MDSLEETDRKATRARLDRLEVATTQMDHRDRKDPKAEAVCLVCPVTMDCPEIPDLRVRPALLAVMVYLACLVLKVNQACPVPRVKPGCLDCPDKKAHLVNPV